MIDTAAKRFSAIHHGNPWRGVATLPTGTIGQASRQSVLWMYSGILFGGGITGFGRIEFTIPRSTLEFAVAYQPLDYTLPKTVEEFGVETP